jgi:hypothetical protein
MVTAATWRAAEWAAFGTCATLLVYIVIGLLAWRQIRESRELRELQTRPYVIVDFEFRRSLVYIVVKNIGTTPALDVSIKFDKPLRTSSATRLDVNEASVFKAPIAMLAPGRAIRVVFDVSHQFFAEDLPRSYTATVTYRDHARKRPYADPPYVLDMSQYQHSALDPEGLPELVGAVTKMRDEMHKWTDGTRGLLAFVVDRRSHVTRSDRGFWTQKAARIRNDEGWIAYARWMYDRLLRRHGWR